ncbi:MAG: hypothetical protein ACI808_001128 [Paraglaciecola sp.]|jgi:uncharacterized protein (DUF58 family)
MLINWQSHMSRWLDKRIPAARSFQLDMRNIFIFPAKFGWLFLFLCVGLFLLGTNYQNNLMLLMCYFLLSLFLITLFASYVNFSKTHIQIGKVQHVFVDDSVHVPIWINAHINSTSKESRKTPHGLYELKYIDQENCYLADADELSNPTYLDYCCNKRGVLSLPRVTVSSTYPLGLFRCWTHLAFDTEILVYPKPLPCENQLIRINRANDSGSHTSTHAGHDDFESLKAYQVGEPLHHVAWKQLAKGRGMISKQFASTSSQTGWLKLMPCTPAILETRLSHMCFQVIELSRNNHTFGLDLGQNCIVPNAGSEHRDSCLKALAMFTWHDPR